MKTEIVLTHDWTNPETGEAHKAGARIFVDAGLVRNDAASGLAGKYTFPDPYIPVHAVSPAPKKQASQPLAPTGA